MKILARVPSLTRDGARWTIRQFADGPGCDCPSFEFSAEPKTCKHLAIYEAARHAIERCLKAGHGADAERERSHRGAPALCEQCLVEVLAVAARRVSRRYVAKETVEAIKAKASAKVVSMRERMERRRKK